jgi:hypothetical protein
MIATLIAALWLGCSPAWATLALDGSAHHSVGSGTTVSATLTTTQAGDVIIVIVGPNGGPITGVSGSSLGACTFRARTTGVGNAGHVLEEWFCVASSPLSNEVITATQTTSDFVTIDVFGISGANTSSPFDGTAVTASVSPRV